MTKFYAYELVSDELMGKPNPITGKYSRGIELRRFSTKAKRDNWVQSLSTTGRPRFIVSLAKARSLLAGRTKESFDQFLETEYSLDTNYAFRWF